MNIRSIAFFSICSIIFFATIPVVSAKCCVQERRLRDTCIIPTLITPNDDGLNDQFFIPCIEQGKAPNNSLTILNQWGDLVFAAAPYKNDWQGTFNGKPLPDGTYFFLFRSVPEATTQQGYLTIFR
jgi:gliding motility-associated-like protein